MDLEARDIHEKQFHDAWRGYNQEEVDDFLDRVAEALDRVQRENRSLHQRVRELENQAADSRNSEEMLKRTLVTAQKAAEEAIETARSKAEKLIAEGEERARRQADDSARRNEQADKEHAAKKRELEDSLARLKSHESDLRKKLKGFLEEQLRAVNRLDSTPERAPRPQQTAPEPQRSEPQRSEPRRERPREESAQPGGTRPLRATPSRSTFDDDTPRQSAQAEGSERGKNRSFVWRQPRQ